MEVGTVGDFCLLYEERRGVQGRIGRTKPEFRGRIGGRYRLDRYFCCTRLRVGGLFAWPGLLDISLLEWRPSARLAHLVRRRKGTGMNDGATSTRTLTAVLALAIVVRLVIVVSVSDIGIQIDDEKDYHALASSIVDGRGYTLPQLGATSIRPPLYPAFIAGVWTLTGTRSLQPIRYAQIILSVLSVLLVWRVALSLFDQRVAIIAATLWAFYPSFLYANALILTEVLFSFLLLSVLWAGMLALKSPGCLRMALVGALLGSAALVRSVLWPLPIILAPAAIIVLRKRSGTLQAVAMAAALFIGYVVVVGPWSVRNTRLQHTFTVIDTMGGLNLRMGNFENTIEDRMWDGVSLKGEKAWAHQMFVEHPDARAWTEGQKDKWAQRQAIVYMSHHPVTTMRRAALKFGDFWGLEREYVAALSKGLYRPPTWFAILSAGAVFVVYPIVMGLAVFGLIGAARPLRSQHGFLWLILLFVCAIHTVVFGHSRYHLPIMPICVIYAAAAIAHRPWQAFSRTQFGFACVSMAVLLLFWGRELFIRDGQRLLHFISGVQS